MATLGALWSQQLTFPVTTTAGTTYTHGLGYTPTIIILTKGMSPAVSAVSPWSPGYTSVNATTISIVCDGSIGAAPCVDVLCGSFHSLIK